MNLEIERNIIKSFVIKTRAERIIYELSSKKRRECIWKLAKELFIPECYTEADFSKTEILKILCNNGAGKECYVMSIDE